MFVSGFTFIRNAIIYDYPIVEAITSILPICDEVVVAVGDSKDDTLALIQSIHPTKIKIIPTQWDDRLREGGLVLSAETNKAFAHISPQADWAFYIQGDEVVHEDFLPHILDEMKRWKDDKRVEGLLFHYLHFYGSYAYIGTSPRWYRNEVRIVRNDKTITSFGDAQGFRKNNKLLKVKPIQAYMYHYGWVKEPKAMQKKRQDFNKLWHDDQWIETHVVKSEEFDYSGIDELTHFVGTHPAVMQDRVAHIPWSFDYDLSYNRSSLKNTFKKWVEKYTGIRIGYYKDYKII